MANEMLTEVLRALVRVEKKCDEILKLQKTATPAATVQPIHYGGQSCPLCQKPVVYLTLETGVGSPPETYRVCGCVPVPNPIAGLSGARS